MSIGSWFCHFCFIFLTHNLLTDLFIIFLHYFILHMHWFTVIPVPLPAFAIVDFVCVFSFCVHWANQRVRSGSYSYLSRTLDWDSLIHNHLYSSNSNYHEGVVYNAFSPSCNFNYYLIPLLLLMWVDLFEMCVKVLLYCRTINCFDA